jgi:hypothetical protein
MRDDIGSKNGFLQLLCNKLSFKHFLLIMRLIIWYLNPFITPQNNKEYYYFINRTSPVAKLADEGKEKK